MTLDKLWVFLLEIDSKLICEYCCCYLLASKCYVVSQFDILAGIEHPKYVCMHCESMTAGHSEEWSLYLFHMPHIMCCHHPKKKPQTN